MDKHFVQASSDNLPSVDNDMISDFFVKNVDYIGAEIRGAKATRATKQHYGDSAIGFVQLSRKNNLCTVKARITPEHRIRNKDYNVTVVIDEENESICSGSCSDCAASSCGCKHVIAFIFWLHRKSEEPAPTSVSCYWRSSALSRLGRGATCMAASEIADKTTPILTPAIPNFKELVLRNGLAREVSGILFDSPPEYLLYTSLYYLSCNFRQSTADVNISVQNFSSFCSSKMSDEVCTEIKNLTKLQTKTTLWEKIRFGRITASRIYEIARCKTADGALTEIIMGAALPLKLDAVVRGQKLEDEVLAVVGARMDLSYEKCGIFINKTDPFFGASPDAINEEYVFEIKCPSKESTVEKYIKDGKVTSKPYSQIQLQMHMTGRKKGLFCVASPYFEQNSEVEIITVKYDNDYCKTIMKQSIHFWETVIFKHLMN